ncbi:MAG: hypothetical protein KDA61_22445, partial [Planctomycetales bacterium]|nr:hypothetical protein [Planctomycetales bacterium]
DDDASPRLRGKFDFDWQFHLGEVAGGERSDLSVGNDWRSLNVPHDWSAELEFAPNYASGTGYLPGGIGWYRKTFEAPEAWRDREIYLDFDGVSRNSQVWINGELLGDRPNGYVPFSYRLTPHLKLGKKNVVAVRAAREEVADSRWYPGSGIYRHVWLHVVDKTHVDQWGVHVRTPRVTDARADVAASQTIVNCGPERQRIRVASELIDPDGATLSTQSTEIVAEPGESKTVAHWHVVQQPQRWSLETPLLYALRTRVYQGERLCDEVETPFGIRSFYFHPDKGFILNDRPTLLKGLCLHHDGGVVGAAVPDKTLERRLRIVKELGGNAVRCSHNPMSDEFYHFCDRLGLLVMDEAFDEWELGKRKWVERRNVGTAKRAGYNEAFEQWAERDVAAMVQRGRNHPSIVLWSIGNEIDYPGDPYVHPEYFDPDAPPMDEGSPSATRLAVVAPRLIAEVKRHDPTRPVTMALSNMPAANGVGLAAMLDVCGYNYQEQFYQQDHGDFPGRVIYGSETSRGAPSWQAVVENDYIGGQFLWVGFDFLGEADRWPNHGSRAGVFDTRGFLKPESAVQKARWSERPYVSAFVQAARSDERRGRRRSWLDDAPRAWRGETGKPVDLSIVSNCSEVRVRLANETYDAQPARFPHMFFVTVPYAPGELIVEGLKDQQVVATDSLYTTGKATQIALLADRQALSADGQDVVHVEIQAIDDDG